MLHRFSSGPIPEGSAGLTCRANAKFARIRSSTYLDFVHIANCVVEFYRSSLLHNGLVNCVPTVCTGWAGSWRWRVRISRCRCMVSRRPILSCRHRPLLDRAVAFKRGTLARPRKCNCWRPVLRRHAKSCFRALDTVLHGWLPVWRSRTEVRQYEANPRVIGKAKPSPQGRVGIVTGGGSGQSWHQRRTGFLQV